MYYSSDLLNIKGGKFHVIWFLGCKKDDKGHDKDLSASKIYKTELSKVVRELKELLPRGPSHMSLFLASTLCFGTVKCLYIQVRLFSNHLDLPRQVILHFKPFC